MATTFVKQTNGNVWITVGSNHPISAPGGAFISPHPDEENVIMISEKFNPQNRDEALKIYVSDVTVPEATDRKDLIEKLSTDFFFRVTEFDPETVLVYSAAEVDVLIPFKVLVSENVPHTHTGDTNLTTLFTTTFTPDIGLNGSLDIEMIFSFTGTGTHTVVARLDGVTFFSANPTSSLSQGVEQKIMNRNSQTSQIMKNIGAGFGISGSAVVTFTLNMTTLKTLLITGQNQNAGDSTTLESVRIKGVR